MLELKQSEEGEDEAEAEDEEVHALISSSLEPTTTTTSISRGRRSRKNGGKTVKNNNKSRDRRGIGFLMLLSCIGLLVVMIIPWISHSGGSGMTAANYDHWKKKKKKKNSNKKLGGSFTNFQCPSNIIRSHQNNEEFESKETYGVDKEPMIFDPNNQSSTTIFLETFRNQTFDGWSHTYNEIKQRLYDWKAKHFAPYLTNESTIYESACGLGLNLYMTLEILYETAGLQDITVYGNEYVKTNADMATPLLQTLLKNQSRGNTVGTICQGDSTNLTSWVSSNSFDLVYTGYISPLWDPLNFGLNDVENYHRLEKLCKKAAAASAASANDDNNNNENDGEEDEDEKHWMETKLIDIAQQRQEEWFSTWITELIRIAKPGAPVIVEEVALPYCDILHDWGGVSQDFFLTGHKIYGWDIDPTSIVFEYKKDYKKRRYHVFMLKNAS